MCVDPLLFEEVPAEYMTFSDWKDVMAVKVLHAADIRQLEGGALVLAYKHLLRSAAAVGRRVAIVVDDACLALASCKGRAKSPHLQA
eukprot:4865150-Pyramimonas_sp.AAC.1